MNYIKPLKNANFDDEIVPRIDILPNGDIVIANAIHIEIWDKFAKEKRCKFQADLDNYRMINPIIAIKTLANDYIATLLLDKRLLIINTQTGDCMQELGPLTKKYFSNKILEVLPSGFIVTTVAPNILGIWKFPTLYHSLNHMRKYLLIQSYHLIYLDILKHFNYELEQNQLEVLVAKFDNELLEQIYNYYFKYNDFQRKKIQSRRYEYLLLIRGGFVMSSLFFSVISLITGIVLLLLPSTKIFSIIPFSISLVCCFIILPIAFICFTMIDKSHHRTILQMSHWKANRSNPLLIELNKYQGKDGINTRLESIITLVGNQSEATSNQTCRHNHIFKTKSALKRLKDTTKSIEYINAATEPKASMLSLVSENDTETESFDNLDSETIYFEKQTHKFFTKSTKSGTKTPTKQERHADENINLLKDDEQKLT